MHQIDGDGPTQRSKERYGRPWDDGGQGGSSCPVLPLKPHDGPLPSTGKQQPPAELPPLRPRPRKPPKNNT
jgi:hypothetical protein